MNTFFSECKKSEYVQKVEKELKEGSSFLFESLTPSSKAFISCLAQDVTNKSLIILTGTGPEEYKLFNDLPTFTSTPIIEVPAWETLPSEKIAPSPDIVGARFLAFEKIAKATSPVIVLCPLQSMIQKVLVRSKIVTLFYEIRTGMKIGFDELLNKLSSFGYEKKSIVSDKQEFAVRGGIIDVFPITSPEPFRIEFFGDEVDNIRSFDLQTQKSTKIIPKITLCQAKEEKIIEDEESLGTIFDLVGPSIVILDDLEALEDKYASLTSVGKIESRYFLGIEELLGLIQKKQCLFYTKGSLEELTAVKTKVKKQVNIYSEKSDPHDIAFEMFQRSFSAKRLPMGLLPLDRFFELECFLDHEPEQDELLDGIAQLLGTPETERHFEGVLFLCQKEQEKEKLSEKLALRGLSFSRKLRVANGYLSSGFAFCDLKFCIVPMTELTGRYKVNREKMRTIYQSIAYEALDILPGETVVHFNHGIAKYLGIEKLKNNVGIEQEFFVLEYQDHAKLYVPLTQAHLVSKYISPQESEPRLHTLGASRWKKQREQTEKAILGYASEILKMSAERQLKGGHCYPDDSQDMKDFEELFPYIETDDQLLAIRAVKDDMCSEKAMDRLICGDVGYGKTEVALRAAFKAVVDGKKQVAVLVPTTVLAMQHFENFIDRVNSFQLRVDVVSRFRKPKEIKETLKKLQDGQVDILVGTHRLLQKDVIFKDLGLIIIDEEQRFGVKAKEHLKTLKVGVDCLTLSATPIPRTLYMSLIGARDLSIINTPPQDRLPIKTIIAESDDTLIQTALLRELNRDGQVYFVHNRTESIFAVADHLKRLLPKARIVVGHGQMHPDEIDIVFHKFKKCEADILVTTTIIENGIDIPNANTIIIDNADQFGIADLYQLRGRVGRWNRRAFAYFLMSKRKTLSEHAQKRIEAIAQAGGYGGGMRVAMRDLEIRGEGDILGDEQSGHVSTIGFHLYCKLLKRMIETLKGKGPTWTQETKIETSFDARLPEFYVNDVNLRMEMYQRFGDAMTLQDVDDLFKELNDRFGKPPEQALWLYHLTRLKVIASQKGYTQIKLDNYSIFLEKKEGNSLSSKKQLIQKIKNPELFEKKVSVLL